MPKYLLPICLWLFLIFSSACNREKVNLEGRWEVAQVSSSEKNVDKDSVTHLLLHFAVGNKLYFSGGELTVNRAGTANEIYYGLGTYEVAKNGRSVLIDGGNYKPLKFKLRYADNDQVELLYKRQDVKVLLREPEEE